MLIRFLIALSLLANAASAENLLIQSTTSTANSGLYDHLLPLFTKASGIPVHVVSVGTGQALRNARNCDGDVLLAHAKPAEIDFVKEEFGTERRDVMYNDFIIVGPADDPAGVSGMTNALAALQKIAQAKAPIASRSDDSGTHRKEMALWRAAGIDPLPASGTWYLETGSGMGATLNTGIGLNAYILTDRATWVSFGNKNGHRILVEGDTALFNQYGIIPVNPVRCPTAHHKAALTFMNWLTGPDGQSAIADFRVDGQQLFYPNAAGNKDG